MLVYGLCGDTPAVGATSSTATTKNGYWEWTGFIGACTFSQRAGWRVGGGALCTQEACPSVKRQATARSMLAPAVLSFGYLISSHHHVSFAEAPPSASSPQFMSYPFQTQTRSAGEARGGGIIVTRPLQHSRAWVLLTPPETRREQTSERKGVGWTPLLLSEVWVTYILS